MALPKPPTPQQIQNSAVNNLKPKLPIYAGQATGPAGGTYSPGYYDPVNSRYVPGIKMPTYGAPVTDPYGGTYNPYTSQYTLKPPTTPNLGADNSQVTNQFPQMPQWQEPDWNALINANYLTQGAESQAGPMRAQADINLSSGLRNALYQYGWNPATMDMSKLGAAAPYLSQADIDAAQGNRYSDLATIARNQGYAQTASDAQLAARGMLMGQSGAATEAYRDIAEQAGAQQAGAYSNLMGAVNQGVQARADTEANIQNMLMNARNQAAQFVAQTYQPPSAMYMDPTYLSSLLSWATSQGQQPQAPTGGTIPPPPVAPKTVPKAPAPTYKLTPTQVAKGKAVNTYYGIR